MLIEWRNSDDTWSSKCPLLKAISRETLKLEFENNVNPNEMSYID